MKKNNYQNGFTLIEVVISMLLLMVGVLGAIIMQNTAIKGNSTAIHLTGAVNWASDRQETLMALSDDEDFLADENDDGVNGLDNTTNPIDDTDIWADHYDDSLGDFKVFWNVADNYPILGTKTIRVIVQRLDKGTLKTVTLDFTKMRSIGS